MARTTAMLRYVAAGFAATIVAYGGAAVAQSDGAARPNLIPSPKGDGSTMAPMRRTTHSDRARAALRALDRRKANEAKKKGHPTPPTSGGSDLSGLKGAAGALLQLAVAQVGTVDLYASPNYATSKYPTAHCSDTPDALCQKDADCPGYQPPFLIGPDLYPGGETCTGAVVPHTGIQKFVDTLPGLCDFGTNTLGNCIPLAQPDKTPFPGADYYEIGLKDYTSQFHRDLPNKTKVRGYYQKNTNDAYASKNYYLGPLILAQTNRPVRVKFVNELGTGAAGNLFVPMDSTLAGTDVGPDGLPYTQNRATVHLHGGNSPWISDGTQHQWTVPAGESTTHKKGLSVAYVPDMWFDASGQLITACNELQSCEVPGATNDPGDGALTFYWTNQQSGRFMFYHDHAYGTTRLNVYAGEAAGYLLVNPPEEDRLAAATVPGTIGTTRDLTHLIPLVIQDKTFVPPPAQLAAQDPTWDVAKWGGEDALWFPHVYTPNQWPGNPDLSNTNPVGRWDYGPWFWPVQTSLTTVTTNGDVISRQLTQPCFSVAAVTDANPTGKTECPTLPNPSVVPEAFLDTPVVNGTAYPTLTVDPVSYRFQVLNAANERNLNLSFFVADSSGTEVTMVDAVPHTAKSALPLCSGTAPRSAVTGTPNGPDLTTPACWPREWPVDSRQGGVPDPTTVGPQWVQIGSEAGILPSPAIIPPQPVGYEQNKRNIVVLNVAAKGLFIGPAERADVVVDFSAYAGKTLILYNDSPAPVPAGDPRQDLYTFDADLTTTGGAPTTLPGYGPNNRTIMQITVRGAASGPPRPALDVAQVTTALNELFATYQPKPIVPQEAYNPVYKPATPFTNTYLPIQAMNLTFTPVGDTSPVTIPFGNKALHELFTTDYGRMDSLLGVEIPNTNWLNQTTIPFANYDPTTEYLTDGQPQIWKITHNGVDTHTIHFHLFNAQVLNRVGWDGQVRAPDANELGWKESVRMHPLEDILLALKPVKQDLPWPMPDKIRPLDVDRALGTSTQFTGVDVMNQPITVQNDLVNFGQEYVWHCHLLGHEEADMLRSEVLVVAPEAASGLTAFFFGTPTPKVVLTWKDNSKSAQTFAIQRDTNASFTNPTTFSTPAPTKQPGSVTFTDTTVSTGTTYYYRVQAQKVLTSPALPDQTFPANSAWTAGVAAVPTPRVKLSATSFAYGDVLVGTTSAVQTLTVSNTGSAPLDVTSVAVSGTNAAEFFATNGCTSAVDVGRSCTVQVAFKPGTTGTRSASVAIVTNDPASPTSSVGVSGVGIAPVAGVNKTSLVFVGQALNTTSASQTVTLSNTGTAPLAISSIAVTGANASDFACTKTCETSLAVNATCTVSVTFRPTAVGLRVASLVITSNDLAVKLTLSLDGNRPATGVAVSANISGLYNPNQSVLFTAVGQGASNYDYRFWIWDGSSYTMKQDYGNGASWVMAAPSVSGSYRIWVDVRTTPNVESDAFTRYYFNVADVAVTPATSVTVTADSAGPYAANSNVLLNAIASGATVSGAPVSAALYQYQFSLWNGTEYVLMQDYGVSSSWRMSVPSTPGAYRVYVNVRTTSRGPAEAFTRFYFTVR